MKPGWASTATTLVVALLSSACSTFTAYSGPKLPDSELSTLQCYWRYYLLFSEECHVSGVDGERPGVQEFNSLTAKLSPGKHWVEFEVRSYFGGSSGITACGFEMDFVSGYIYTLVAHSHKTDVGWLERGNNLPYQGSFEVMQLTADGSKSTLRVVTTCRNGGGALCRENSDCDLNPNDARP